MHTCAELAALQKPDGLLRPAGAVRAANGAPSSRSATALAAGRRRRKPPKTFPGQFLGDVLLKFLACSYLVQVAWGRGLLWLKGNVRFWRRSFRPFGGLRVIGQLPSGPAFSAFLLPRSAAALRHATQARCTRAADRCAEKDKLPNPKTATPAPQRGRPGPAPTRGSCQWRRPGWCATGSWRAGGLGWRAGGRRGSSA
jgi:hypothetical protein